MSKEVLYTLQISQIRQWFQYFDHFKLGSKQNVVRRVVDGLLSYVCGFTTKYQKFHERIWSGVNGKVSGHCPNVNYPVYYVE